MKQEKKSTEIKKYNPEVENLSLQKFQSFGEIFFKSNFFPDIQSVSQAIVKMLVGDDLGLSKLQSMQNVFIIKSRGGPKIQLSSTIIAAMIKKSNKYDYEIVELNDKVCKIKFIELPEKVLGEYSFFYERAKKIGLTTKDNWQYPEDMLFNRTISGGYKKYCPDVIMGNVYTSADVIPGEGDVHIENGDYEVLNNQNDLSPEALLDEIDKNVENNGSKEKTEAAAETKVAAPAGPAPKKEEQKKEEPKDEILRDEPRKPGFLKTEVMIYSQYQNTPQTPSDLKSLNTVLGAITIGNDIKRKCLIGYFTGHKSSKDLSKEQCVDIIKWGALEKDDIGGWVPKNFNVIKEADMVYSMYPTMFKEAEKTSKSKKKEPEPAELSNENFAKSMFGEHEGGNE